MLPEFQVTLENPLVIKSNFPQIRERLTEELKKYELEVTEESLSGAKKAMAELSDLAKKIDRARIDYAKQFKAPITAWEAEAKTLFEATNSARDKIAAQVKVFDDKVRTLCKELMEDLLAKEYNRLEVRQEYATGAAMIPGLVGLSCVTKGGQLAKAARENIEGLAMQARAAQDKADGRMARIEADCRAAGVEPLAIEHCRSFIDADDRTFEARKAELIQIEVKRLQAKRDQLEREAKEKTEREEKARKVEEEKTNQPAPEAPPVLQEPARPATQSAPQVSEPAKSENNASDREEIHLYFHVGVSVLAKKGASRDAVRQFVGKLIPGAVKGADARVVACEVQGVEQ